MMNKISKVVSTCLAKDYRVWQVASESILRHTVAYQRILIVPNSEIRLFKKITSSEFDIVAEEHLINPQDIKNSINKKSLPRWKWFYQQFLKIKAISCGDDNDVNIIWDADTVALKDISPFSENKLLYFTSNEYHSEYFRTIRQILNLEKTVSFSFISQIFPTRVKWVRSMIDEIRYLTGRDWIASILEVDTPEHQLYFSEYETLGTYINNYFHDEIISNKPNIWNRFAGLDIINMNNINYSYLSAHQNKFNYVALEYADILESMNFYQKIRYKTSRKLVGIMR